MKTLLITLSLIAGLLTTTLATPPMAGPGTPPADSATYKLTIDFPNITKRTGMLYVGLVNNAADVNGNSCRKTRVAIPAEGNAQVSFDGLPAGRYMVKVFQDLNDNLKLDISGGIPTEPFGFSNVTTLMGPPSFEQCAFELNATKTVTISLIGL